MASRRGNANLLARNIVLHATSLIDCQFDTLVDGATKAAVVLGSIKVIGVVFWVVDVVFGAVAAKAFGGDFELAGAVAEGHETKDPEENADGLGGDVLDRADINSLGWREWVRIWCVVGE